MKHNHAAKALRDARFKPRVVRNKAKYTRKTKHRS